MAPKTTPAIEKCRKAAARLGWRHPHFYLLHDRMAYREDPSVGTMAVSADGLIYVAPAFVDRVTPDELSGCVAHEILHPTLRHFERAKTLGIIGSDGKIVAGREEDAKIWNSAGDWTINHALRSDGIQLPKGALEIDPDYLKTGAPIQAEPIYHWLKSQLKQGKSPSGMSDPSEGEPSPGAGCGVRPPSKPGNEQSEQGAGQGDQDQGEGQAQGDQPYGLKPGESWESVAAEARAHAMMAGKGSSALASILQPFNPTIDWAKVIRRGFNLAQVRPGAQFSTYSRISRRQGLDRATIRPGWYGGVPRVAIVVDVSSSMAREWVAQIVAETLGLMATFGTKAFLVTHTDQVCWSGWVKHGDRDAIVEACQHGGGTDARPAYARVAEEQTRFDALVHFTDCELPGKEWPENPARKLVVGAFGSGAENPYTPIPEGAEFIPCHTPAD